jgi:hypothetical protein
MDTVTMGSPLSLAVAASYFMEDFNEEALSEAVYALHCWFQYVDIYNTVTKAEKLTALLDYLNSRHSHTQFTMDTERGMATGLSWKLTATEER